MMATTHILDINLSNKDSTAYGTAKAKTDSDLDCSIQKNTHAAATILPVYVSLCLGSHKECTGFYGDEHGQFLLKCGCSCHQSDKHDDAGDECKLQDGWLGKW